VDEHRTQAERRESVFGHGSAWAVCGKLEHFLTDTLGNTVATTDATGAAATQYTYEPFGNATSTGPTSSNALQYTGRENDGTGLYFYRTRYYSPRLQRFISQDPIGFAGGDINLYAYIFNSPTNYFDPTGQFGWPVHVRITKDALQRAGLPPDPAMAQQVAAVDREPGSQGPDADTTNTHAMAGMTTGRKPHRQTCEEAHQGTQNQIAQDFNSGNFTKAAPHDSRCVFTIALSVQVLGRCVHSSSYSGPWTSGERFFPSRVSGGGGHERLDPVPEGYTRSS